MSLLYPRLLKPRARDLAEEYRTLQIPELTARAALSDESAVYVATGGARAQGDKLRQIRELVVSLAEASGYPNAPTSGEASSFDLAVAEHLHREMHLAPAEASATDVWAFQSLVLMPDIAQWRFPGKDSSDRAYRERIRGSRLDRHVFGRLWWRAQLVYAPAESNPYAALKVLGEAAFDQIYARRSSLGASPHLVKSILRVWNSLDLRGLTERDVLRDFLKRLLRLAPFVVFDAIDEASLDDELRAVAHETVFATLILAGWDGYQASQRANAVVAARGWTA
ncbi:DUF6339 family protein [Nocardia huaxiensis]|uniref:DUF6339 family protein n=1 Tax=Nocardia huaxiensis TaxID=2755382 RepID=UPI001E5B67F6|nr:DUF6339 family protein [Nocardia huaxiensis]UFS96413.1 DUF6339 family protein [Nocardia huaxiensis]